MRGGNSATGVRPGDKLRLPRRRTPSPHTVSAPRERSRTFRTVDSKIASKTRLAKTKMEALLAEVLGVVNTMAAAFQQQIFALDARFNAYRAPNLPNFTCRKMTRPQYPVKEPGHRHHRGSCLMAMVGIPSGPGAFRLELVEGLPVLAGLSNRLFPGGASESPYLLFQLQGNTIQIMLDTWAARPSLQSCRFRLCRALRSHRRQVPQVWSPRNTRCSAQRDQYRETVCPCRIALLRGSGMEVGDRARIRSETRVRRDMRVPRAASCNS
ncbi:hypothetical protein EVAR_28413_1 [Eumeta japonica]|uniref:Uncharacterized protein n=1 Tax=Eumeta variegata TaxID=151549 RepID=A0A4C1V7U5_EUMVA|nr:hypothetical protein EVAR_28413_1 [Eumeta japonica]